MGKKILIIDDEPELVNTISAVLTQRGYEVLSATDGESGVSLADSECPDLVITDLNMPNLDGWRVCQHIKQTAATACIPVIMLSALVDTTSVPSEIELGDSYIGKPFKMKELIEEVQRLLRG